MNHPRRSHKLHPYVALVEGEQAGVPFQCFYKRMDVAEHDAILTGGRLTDLRTLQSRIWVREANEWRDA